MISIIIAILIIGSGENMSEIDKAAILQRNVFVIYILTLMFTVFLSVIVWITSNKYQDAIKKDADAKIANSKVELEKANKSIAELSLRLEETKISILKMEKEVAEAKRKQAEAEKSLEELRIEAKKAARGVTSIYGFGGEKRETVGGNISVTVGEENSVFQQMTKLQKEGKWHELMSLCNSQITKTPEWLTPYLYLGVAEANLGMKNEAISNFEYVIKNAPGDPNYQEANELIRKLKDK